jgi:hypothetical protein
MKYTALSTSAAVLKKRSKYLQLFMQVNDVTPLDPSLVDNIEWEVLSKELAFVYCSDNEEQHVGRVLPGLRRGMEIPGRDKRVQNVQQRRSKKTKGRKGC